MHVTVQVDAAGVRRALAGLSDATSNRAIVRALNRAVDAGKTEAIKLTREELNLRAADVRESISVRKSGASLTRAEIVIAPKPVPLIDYGARQTKPGVTVRVNRAGGRSLVRHAFLATMKSGHRGVFTRTPKAGGAASRRLPIRELFSTSVRQLFKRQRAVDRVTKRAAEAFATTALNQIQQALRLGRAV